MREGLSADPQQVRKIFDFPVPKDNIQLQPVIVIVNYLSEFLPQLARIDACLTNLQGTTHSWPWTDNHAEAVNQYKY